jgi:ribonuclease Z
MKKHAWAYAAAAAVMGVALLWRPVENLALRSPTIQKLLVERGFRQVRAQNKAMVALVDAPELRVILCGTASPLAIRERAGPCAAVVAGGHLWLVDVGGGGWRNLGLWHLPGEKLAAVLLTHFHSDHIQDLGDVNLESWVAGRAVALPVYGGPGVATVVNGFNAAYSLDSGYRIAHHGVGVLPPQAQSMVPHAVETAPGIALKEGETRLVLDQDGMKITAIGVNHAPVSPAYGYRFDYRGRSVVISGDTRPSPAFAMAAKGADVLVHEAQSNAILAQLHDLMAQQGNARLAKVLNDIQSYHTDPAQAAQIANLAGAKLLVLTHITPALPGFLAEPVFMQAVERERPHGSLVGHDGLMISLPAGSDALDISDLR